MSKEMTIDDLRRILVTCAGDVDNVDINGDIADQRFDDLGYDSLALLESAARIEGEFGVRIPDDRISELETPREVLAFVNGGVLDPA